MKNAVPADMFTPFSDAIIRRERGDNVSAVAINQARDKIIEHLRQQISLTSLIKCENKKIRRLAIVVSWLSTSHQSAHLKALLNISRAFAKAIEPLSILLVFSGGVETQEARTKPTSDLRVEPFNWMHARAALPQAFQDLLDGPDVAHVQYAFPSPGQGIAALNSAQSQAVSTIFNFAPDAILCPSGLYSSMSMPAILQPFFPIIEMPFNIQNQLSSYADALLGLLPKPRAQSDAAYVPVPSWPETFVPVNAPPHDLGLDQKAIVMVSTLTGNRISASLRGQALPNLDGEFKTSGGKFLQRIIDIMERHQRLYWVIVGEYRIENLMDISPKFDKLIDNGRVKVLDHVDNLCALYRQTHIYLQPHEAHGGGQCAAMAALCGLPIVLFNDCDPMRTMPAFKHTPTLETGFAYLERLITDPNYRAYRGRACHDAVDISVDDIDFSPYRAVIVEARKRFCARTELAV